MVEGKLTFSRTVHLVSTVIAIGDVVAVLVAGNALAVCTTPFSATITAYIFLD